MRDVMAKRVMRWAGAALLAAMGLGCDGATSAPVADESGLSVAGFTLTGDDESDDGFNEQTDYRAILEALGVDAQREDGDVPPEGEVDPEALPPEGPDRVARAVLVTWGQPRLNEAMADTPTAWVGALRTDVGALKVLRTVRFERGPEGTDKLVRDEDPQTVSFETVTGPHHDGVLVKLVLPRRPEALTGEFHFETGHFAVSVPLARLVMGGVQSFDADALGNVVTIASHEPHRCPHGLVGLRWERRGERGGVFGGKVFGRDGELVGFAVGLWGVVDGRPRMKGAMLSPEYGFRGRLKGVWVPFERPEGGEGPAAGEGAGAQAGGEGQEPRFVPGGTFQARWLGPADRVLGVVGGVFRVGEERGQGTAQGFWRLACENSRPECGEGPMPPAPPEASCACDEAAGECACEAPPAPSCVPPEQGEGAPAEPAPAE